MKQVIQKALQQDSDSLLTITKQVTDYGSYEMRGVRTDPYSILQLGGFDENIINSPMPLKSYPGRSYSDLSLIDGELVLDDEELFMASVGSCSYDDDTISFMVRSYRIAYYLAASMLHVGSGVNELLHALIPGTFNNVGAGDYDPTNKKKTEMTYICKVYDFGISASFFKMDIEKMADVYEDILGDIREPDPLEASLVMTLLKDILIMFVQQNITSVSMNGEEYEATQETTLELDSFGFYAAADAMVDFYLESRKETYIKNRLRFHDNPAGIKLIDNGTAYYGEHILSKYNEDVHGDVETFSDISEIPSALLIELTTVFLNSDIDELGMVSNELLSTLQNVANLKAEVSTHIILETVGDKITTETHKIKSMMVHSDGISGFSTNPEYQSGRINEFNKLTGANVSSLDENTLKEEGHKMFNTNKNETTAAATETTNNEEVVNTASKETVAPTAGELLSTGIEMVVNDVIKSHLREHVQAVMSTEYEVLVGNLVTKVEKLEHQLLNSEVKMLGLESKIVKPVETKILVEMDKKIVELQEKLEALSKAPVAPVAPVTVESEVKTVEPKPVREPIPTTIGYRGFEPTTKEVRYDGGIAEYAKYEENREIIDTFDDTKVSKMLNLVTEYLEEPVTLLDVYPLTDASIREIEMTVTAKEYTNRDGGKGSLSAAYKMIADIRTEKVKIARSGTIFGGTNDVAVVSPEIEYSRGKAVYANYSTNQLVWDSLDIEKVEESLDMAYSITGLSINVVDVEPILEYQTVNDYIAVAIQNASSYTSKENKQGSLSYVLNEVVKLARAKVEEVRRAKAAAEVQRREDEAEAKAAELQRKEEAKAKAMADAKAQVEARLEAEAKDKARAEARRKEAEAEAKAQAEAEEARVAQAKMVEEARLARVEEEARLAKEDALIEEEAKAATLEVIDNVNAQAAERNISHDEMIEELKHKLALLEGTTATPVTPVTPAPVTKTMEEYREEAERLGTNNACPASNPFAAFYNITPELIDFATANPLPSFKLPDVIYTDEVATSISALERYKATVQYYKLFQDEMLVVKFCDIKPIVDFYSKTWDEVEDYVNANVVDDLEVYGFEDYSSILSNTYRIYIGKKRAFKKSEEEIDAMVLPTGDETFAEANKAKVKAKPMTLENMVSNATRIDGVDYSLMVNQGCNIPDSGSPLTEGDIFNHVDGLKSSYGHLTSAKALELIDITPVVHINDFDELANYVNNNLNDQALMGTLSRLYIDIVKRNDEEFKESREARGMGHSGTAVEVTEQPAPEPEPVVSRISADLLNQKAPTVDAYRTRFKIERTSPDTADEELRKLMNGCLGLLNTYIPSDDEMARAVFLQSLFMVENFVCAAKTIGLSIPNVEQNYTDLFGAVFMGAKEDDVKWLTEKGFGKLHKAKN